MLKSGHSDFKADEQKNAEETLQKLQEQQDLKMKEMEQFQMNMKQQQAEQPQALPLQQQQPAQFNQDNMIQKLPSQQQDSQLQNQPVQQQFQANQNPSGQQQPLNPPVQVQPNPLNQYDTAQGAPQQQHQVPLQNYVPPPQNNKSQNYAPQQNLRQQVVNQQQNALNQQPVANQQQNVLNQQPVVNQQLFSNQKQPVANPQQPVMNQQQPPVANQIPNRNYDPIEAQFQKIENSQKQQHLPQHVDIKRDLSHIMEEMQNNAIPEMWEAKLQTRDLKSTHVEEDPLGQSILTVRIRGDSE